MELIRIVISIAAVTFVGFNVLYLVSGKTLKLAFAEKAAVSYGFGFGLVSLEMLLFYFLGWKFSIGRILAPWLLLIAVNLAVYLARHARPGAAKLALAESGNTGFLGKFLFCGIAFEVLYATFRALVKPLESYDAIAIYAIRSKIFYLARGISHDYFAAIGRLFPHADYPLNIQLSESFLYMSMGSMNDQLVKIIFPLFFAAILCMLYFAVRRFAGRTYSLAFTFVLATIPHFNNYATNAYLEVPLAFYIFVSGLFLLRWFEDTGSVGALSVSAVAAGLAGWTKNEGMLYCVIYASLVFIFVITKGKKAGKKDILYAFLYSGIILAICLPWAIAKAKWQIVNDEIALSNINPGNLIKQLHKLGPISYELQKQLFGPKKWNILWPVLFLAIFFNYKKALDMPQRYAAMAILLALAGYVVFYMISYVDVVFFTSKTWARFLIDFLPLAVYLLAVVLKDDVKC